MEPVLNAQRAHSPQLSQEQMTSRERYHPEVYQFGGKFGTLSKEQFWAPDAKLMADPDFHVLRQIITKMIVRMEHMNRLGRAIPNDSVESLLLKMTRPSSFVIAQVENDPKSRSVDNRNVRGFGILIKDPKECPDYDEWPEALKKDNPARLYRLVVDLDAKLCGEHSESSCGRILEEAARIAGPQRLLALILMSHYPDDHELHPAWLEARDSLIPKGFEDTGFAHIQTFEHRHAVITNLFFKWHLYPGQSDQARKALRDYQARYTRARIGWRRRLAEISPHVHSCGARILCLGEQKVDGHEVAAMFHGNYVIEGCLGTHPSTRPGLERLDNVRVVENVDPAVYNLGPDFFDLIYDSLPLENSEAPSRVAKLARIKATLVNQVPQLKDNRCLIWHKSVTLDEVPSSELVSRGDLERAMREAGLRIVCSHPDQPNYYRSLKRERAVPIPWRIVAEKVPQGEGVEIVQTSKDPARTPSFLRVSCYRSRDGQCREIVEHDHENLVIVPWYQDLRGDEYVVLNTSYPRPIAVSGSEPADGSRKRAYNHEAIARFRRWDNEPSPEQLKQEVAETLLAKAGITAEEIKSIDLASFAYFTAPRDFNDHVHPTTVRIQPLLGRRSLRYEGLTSRPAVQAIKARHFLRACQRGGMTDARLEREIYKLLLSRKAKLGTWIGEDLVLRTQATDRVTTAPLKEIFRPPKIVAFAPAPDVLPIEYEILQGTFVEKDRREIHIATLPLEYARRTPESGRGTNAVSILPVLRVQSRNGKDETYAAVSMLESPVAQDHLGTALMAASITFDIPEAEAHLDDYVRNRLKEKFGLETLGLTPVGEAYFTCPRISARRVVPLAAEVTLDSLLHSKLKLIRLADLVEHAPELKDGNLLTLTYRVAHAAGTLQP